MFGWKTGWEKNTAPVIFKTRVDDRGLIKINFDPMPESLYKKQVLI
jgi:hypothetical protein